MDMSQEIRVPDIGDFKDVPIIEVSVKVGDVIAADDTIIVLESDKATLDVPAPAAGRVSAIKVAPGDLVSQGALILTLERTDADAPAVPLAAEPAPAAAETTVAVALPAPAQSAPPQPRAEIDALPHASPAVRKIAREFGVNLAEVTGSGPKERILKEDVQAFVRARLAAPAATPGTGLDLLPWPQTDFAKFGEIERAALSKIRKISGANLARNAIVIPHVTNFDEADVTELDAFRIALNGETGRSAKLTLLAFLIKAAAATLKAFPAFNASLDGEELILKRYYNIGFAVDTTDGLVVPNIKSADTKGLTEIAAECAQIAAEARAGRLKSADIQGATFTVSSLGGIGGTGFTPIINAPEVAILGVVRAEMKPKWDGVAFCPRLIQPLSLSWDHRVVDGVAAARFLRHLSGLLEDFRRISL